MSTQNQPSAVAPGAPIQKLSDFKPLEHVELPGLGGLDCSGLILIVGPNSSGKTQLLHDLHERIRGNPRTLVVAREIKLRKADLAPFLSCLEGEGYLTSFTDGSGARQFRLKTTYTGTGEYSPVIQAGQAKEWYDAYADPRSTVNSEQAWLNRLGRLVVTVLFLERRLIPNQAGLIDFQTEPPQHDIHVLYLDDRAKAELLEETRNTFNSRSGPMPLKAKSCF